ncbi:MAG TPA: class I lanthipeptide [Haliangium sp.]|nr:class I lanthipeptide [Haliangium sp.]
MKKQKNSQKLTLSRQTLRRLESPQLAQVVGGTVVTCVPTQCTTGFAFSGANC